MAHKRKRNASAKVPVASSGANSTNMSKRPKTAPGAGSNDVEEMEVDGDFLPSVNFDIDAEETAESTPLPPQSQPQPSTLPLGGPGPKKKAVLAPEVASKLEERKAEGALYNQLADEDAAIRNEAALTLLRKLLGDEENGVSGVSEAEFERHLAKRLFHGLSSGRSAARIGLSLVLTELLSQLFGRDTRLCQSTYPSLSFRKVLELLMEHNEPQGHLPGQEERNYYFGQLFGLECFVKARIFHQDDAPSDDSAAKKKSKKEKKQKKDSKKGEDEGEEQEETDQDPSGSERWFLVLEKLVHLGNTKVWLRPQCGWIIAQALANEQIHQSADIVQRTLEYVRDHGMPKSPEGAGLWLVASQYQPTLEVAPWGNPLATKVQKDLVSVLRESVQDPDNYDIPRHLRRQPNSTTQLHFVWDVLRDYFSRDPAPTKTDEFTRFWTLVVDEGLFSHKATEGQKYRGFLVFQRFLTAFTERPGHVEALFTPNFVSCLVNQAAQSDRMLHNAALKAQKTIVNVATVSPSSKTVVMPIVRGILSSKNNMYHFDIRSKTKTLEKVLQQTPAEEAEACAALLTTRLEEAIAAAKKGEDQDVEAETTVLLQAYVEYLFKIIDVTPTTPTQVTSVSPSAAPESNIAVAGEALQKLISLAYATEEEQERLGITERILKLSKTRLESGFAKLVRRSRDATCVCSAVLSINRERFSMTEELKSELDIGLETVRKLLAPSTDRTDDDGKSQKKSKKSKKKDAVKEEQQSNNSSQNEEIRKGLALLYAVSIFQLYNEDEDALNTLHDLKNYYETALLKEDSRHDHGKKDKTPKGKSHDSHGHSDDEEEPDANRLAISFVEILLAMVARPSSLTREVSQKVFEIFSHSMTQESLAFLTEVLSASEDVEGQKQLFQGGDEVDDEEQENEDEDEDEDDEMEGEEIDGSAFLAALGMKEGDESGSEASDEDDPEDDSEEEEEDDESEKDDEKKKDAQNFEDKLASVLGSHRLDKDLDASDGDASDMSDSEMLNIDSTLTAAFRSRLREQGSARKKEAKTAKLRTVTFKHRVLDFVEIYTRVQAASVLSLTLLPALAQLVRTTGSKDLANRAMDIITNHQKAMRQHITGKTTTSSTSSTTASTHSIELHPSLLPSPAASLESPSAPLKESLEKELLLSTATEALDACFAEITHKTTSIPFSKALSHASLTIVSALFALDREAIVDVAAKIAELQSSWVLGQIRIHSYFFTNWLNWCQSRANNQPSSASKVNGQDESTTEKKEDDKLIDEVKPSKSAKKNKKKKTNQKKQ